ncbi:MAG: SMC-Scp complex subunit ScpB [Clostridia bacterium]|nr:SMC-Scp complex subunit ScpB [Clostridia bacterium]
MTFKQMQSAVEAVLFAAGEPLEIEKLAQALEIEVENAQSLVMTLSDAYDERESGLQIVKMGDKYQICTRKEYSEQIRSVLELKRNAPLSSAAFEVLAVIAYNQPITKAYVEQVRGVDCTGVITTLCQKGLIEEVGRLELPGRPLIYGTTAEFLKCFCISSLDDLPDVPELNEKPDEEAAAAQAAQEEYDEQLMQPEDDDEEQEDEE